jgi:hypothetical protein
MQLIHFYLSTFVQYKGYYLQIVVLELLENK